MFVGKRTSASRVTGNPPGVRALAISLFAMVITLPAMQSALAASPWIAQSSGNPPDSGTVATADTNNDGIADVVLFGHDSTTTPLTAYQNTGTPASPVWSAAAAGWSTITLCDTSTNYAPALADLNGDGVVDLVLGTRLNLCLYKNTGTNAAPIWTRADGTGAAGHTASGENWEAGIPSITASLYDYFSPSIGDLDGDGKPDIVLGDFVYRFVFIKNTGTTTLPSWTKITRNVDPPSTRSPALADLDGDGVPDLLIRSVSTGYLYAYHNTGSATAPQWTYAPNWSLFPAGAGATSTSEAGIAVSDLNGDHKADLIVSDPSGTTVYLQSSAGMGDPGSTSGPGGVTGLVSDTFDSFSCPGSWQSDPTGPNSSYSRDCGNGWSAYAEDMSNTLLTPDPLYAGPVGDQNIVTLDNTANGPSAAPATPLGAALMNTAPGSAPQGVLWLLKSFPVQPGVPIQVLKGDLRTKYTGRADNYALWLFDGKVTSPYGITDGLHNSLRTDVLANQNYDSGSSKTCAGVAVGDWCPWQQADLIGNNYVVPTQSYITVAFRADDTSASYQPFAEFDNLVVSNVTTSSSSPVPTNDIAQLWSSSYQAGGTDNMAWAADIVTDSSGNTYVTGTRNTDIVDASGNLTTANYDILLLKYDSTGALAWTREYNSPDNNDDEAVAMALDATGNIDIIGRGYNGTDNDYEVLKYNSSGTLRWSATYDNAGNDDVPAALATDASGNVFVTGRSCNAPGACDYATVAFAAADGSPLWSGAALYDAGGDDEAVGIKLDASGNVYITGHSFGTSDDIVTVRYDSSGAQQWVTRYDSGTNDYATALAVDGSGNSYVTGYSYDSNGGSPGIVVLKYGSGGGSPLWQKTYGGGTTQAMPSAMAIDGSGSVYVTGKVGQVANYDMVTLKYLTDGTLAWAQTYGNANLNDFGTDVAVDGGGNVYVLGSLSQVTGNADFVTVKYSSAGLALNAITYDGSSTLDAPAALALGVDAQGDTTAYVTGTSMDDASGLGRMETLGYEKAQPDLTMTQLSGPATAVINGTIGVANTVLNVSDLANKIYADSGVFTVSFYLAPSVSGSPDLGQLASIGTRVIDNITPGQSDAAITPLTIPAATAAGDYFLVALADSMDKVKEAHEDNNQVIASSPITIAASDLVVSDISAPTSIDHTQPFDVTVTVSNLVSSPTPSATPFRVGIYMSAYPDSTITTGDTLIGSYTLTDFSGFGSDTTTVTIPANTVTPGQYFIGAIVDDQNVIIEANETNNSAVLQAPAGNSALLTTDADFNAGLGVIDPITSTSTNNVAVVGTGTAASVFLAKDTGNTALDWSPQAWSPPGSAYGLGDLDGDGLPDLLTGSANANAYVFAYKNTGTASTPAWTEETGWEINTAGQQCQIGINTAQYSHPRLADLNGDNIPDLVVATRNGVCIYQNTGTGLVGDPPVWSRNTAWESGLTTLATNKFYTVALGDLDGDGKVDMMLNGVAYQNTGTTTVPAWTAKPAWDIAGGGTLALGDVDGDGKIDVIQGQSAGGEVFGYQNTGTVNSPIWTANTSWDITGLGAGANTATAPELGDLDGDGRLDLLVQNTGTVTAFKNITVTPYVTSGTFISNVIDAGVHGGYTTLSYTPGIPPYTSIQVDIRAGDTATPDNTWTPWATNIAVNGDISSLGTNRYVQYRVVLGTNDVTASPELDNIEAHKLPPGTDQYSVVSVQGGNNSGGGEINLMDLLALGLFLVYGRSRASRRVGAESV